MANGRWWRCYRTVLAAPRAQPVKRATPAGMRSLFTGSVAGAAPRRRRRTRPRLTDFRNGSFSGRRLLASANSRRRQLSHHGRSRCRLGPAQRSVVGRLRGSRGLGLGPDQRQAVVSTDARLGHQVANRRRGGGPFTQPVVHAVQVDPEERRLLDRIVVSQVLDEPAVAGRTAVGDHDAVVGLLLFSIRRRDLYGRASLVCARLGLKVHFSRFE